MASSKRYTGRELLLRLGNNDDWVVAFPPRPPAKEAVPLCVLKTAEDVRRACVLSNVVHRDGMVRAYRIPDDDDDPAIWNLKMSNLFLRVIGSFDANISMDTLVDRMFERATVLLDDATDDPYFLELLRGFLTTSREQRSPMAAIKTFLNEHNARHERFERGNYECFEWRFEGGFVSVAPPPEPDPRAYLLSASAEGYMDERAALDKGAFSLGVKASVAGVLRVGAFVPDPRNRRPCVVAFRAARPPEARPALGRDGDMAIVDRSIALLERVYGLERSSTIWLTCLNVQIQTKRADRRMRIPIILKPDEYERLRRSPAFWDEGDGTPAEGELVPLTRTVGLHITNNNGTKSRKVVGARSFRAFGALPRGSTAPHSKRLKAMRATTRHGTIWYVWKPNTREMLAPLHELGIFTRDAVDAYWDFVRKEIESLGKFRFFMPDICTSKRTGCIDCRVFNMGFPVLSGTAAVDKAATLVKNCQLHPSVVAELWRHHPTLSGANKG